MKTQILLTAAGIALLGGCTATRFAGGELDGIYYDPQQSRVRQAPQMEQHGRDHAQQTYQLPGHTANQQVEEYTEYSDYELRQQETYYEDGEYYADPGYFNLDYYYDFSYAARIRRFHSPHFRWSYFDPWFTNMFWYTHNPLYFGISIYQGFGSMGFHFPAFMHFYPGFYWYTWHSPFHWHSPWHFSRNHWGWWAWNTHWHRHWWSFGTWGMWNRGFWSGFHAGLHHGWWSHPAHFQYIYNSRDRSNYLYGHRRPIGTVIGAGDIQRQDRNRSFAERFENRNRNNPPTPGTVTTPPTGVSERGRTMQPGSGVVGGGAQPSPGRAGGTILRDPQRGAAGAGTQREVRDRGEGGVRTEPRETMGGTQPAVRDPQSGRVIREMPNQRETRPERTAERPTREIQPERPQHRQPETRTPEQPTMRQPESRNPIERTPSDRQVMPQRNPDNMPARGQQERQERMSQPQDEGRQPGPQRPRTYTPPSYQQPRSTQEYRSPQMTRPATQQRPETQTAPRQMEQPRERPQQQNIHRHQERSQPSFSPPPRQHEPQRSAPPVRSEPPPSREPSGGSMSPQPSRSTGSESGRSSEGGRQL